MSVERVEASFRRSLDELGLADGPHHLLVAVSGGLDSMVLLHLLRFRTSGLPLRLSVAHFDHGMRATSAADAVWLKGVCAAWSLPLVSGRAEHALRGETAAREARHRFLQEIRSQVEADSIATAHHADDQAETVLFRILRGTGIAGLRGMRPVTESGLVRPLLSLWRRDLAIYARSARLRWRTDPTNLTRKPVRNRIRLDLIPALERHEPMSARQTLVSLADLAVQIEEVWEPLMTAAEEAIVGREGAAVLLAREGLRGYSSPLAARLLRRIFKQFDLVPSRAGTAAAIQFITHAPSGRELQLPRGVRVKLERDVARIERALEIPPDLTVQIPMLKPGQSHSGTLRLGGARYRANVSRAGGALDSESGRWRVVLPTAALRFPLLIRARAAGDRVRTTGGSKTLKKLLIERRVPRSQRARLPVLTDATGTVVWFAGGDAPSQPLDPSDDDALILTIRDD